ncbi:MAG: UDP-3-O-acyl-N-acetylglucosamine deacetylase, partial [Phycisphaerales bacterium]|nr:UDP-3-O-acyl-N-acetylglucosamine deacetylase [Phycisphaerales bacterium]
MKHQHTITREVELQGRGLFTGEPVSMRVRPAPANSGICFIRTDQSPPIRIEAVVENVSKRARRTSLRNGTVAIETVEHCLSACAGLDLDNLQIELDANELPGLDGSSLAFVQKLRDAGVCEQDAFRAPHLISDVLRVAEGDSELVALPPLDPNCETLELI